MTKEEAIQYLQQLYPNGGHCWLDEQRIEAIEMAIKALQEEPASDTQSPVVFYGLTGSVGNTKEEPVSEELKEFEVEYIEREKDNIVCIYDRHAGLVDGAQWQKEQLEKNRLAACDAQTEEEAEIERDFVTGIIKKERRLPTFDDAIKYGMKKMKEQMMAKAIDAKLSEGHLIRQKCVTHPLHVGDKVKVILIKED